MAFHGILEAVILLVVCKLSLQEEEGVWHPQKQSDFFRELSNSNIKEECMKTTVSQETMEQCIKFGLSEGSKKNVERDRSEIEKICYLDPLPQRYIKYCLRYGFIPNLSWEENNTHKKGMIREQEGTTKLLRNIERAKRDRSEIEKICYLDPLPQRYIKYCLRYGFIPNLSWEENNTHKKRMTYEPLKSDQPEPFFRRTSDLSDLLKKIKDALENTDIILHPDVQDIRTSNKRGTSHMSLGNIEKQSKSPRKKRGAYRDQRNAMKDRDQ